MKKGVSDIKERARDVIYDEIKRWVVISSRWGLEKHTWKGEGTTQRRQRCREREEALQNKPNEGDGRRGFMRKRIVPSGIKRSPSLL